MQNNEIFKSYSELMKRAKDPFNSMWQSEWKDIFNEEVNYVLFFSHSQSDEVESELKKLLSEIKKIHSRINIGNDFEIQFLAYYCMIEQILDKNFDIKEADRYAIYRIAHLKLMR